MSDTAQENTEAATGLEDLKPKKPSNRAPQGIRTFTVCRQHDETGISGEGVVIEGVLLPPATQLFIGLPPLPVAQLHFLMHSMTF